MKRPFKATTGGANPNEPDAPFGLFWLARPLAARRTRPDGYLASWLTTLISGCTSFGGWTQSLYRSSGIVNFVL